MILRDERKGVEITLEYDEDGYPLVNISLGGGFQGDNDRPAVEVKLDGVLIHDMFDDQDERWAEGHCALCGEPIEPGDKVDEGEYGTVHHNCPDFQGDEEDEPDA
jgi:hypothetical protein